MSGYTKLFSSILTSSIWGEADHTRIVWITLLALADKNGDVSASVGGLARSANLDRSRCEEAIQVLSSPDPDDRSGVENGIRILPIQGGWHIVNYAAYREKMRSVDRAEYLRLKQREHRAKRQQSVNKSTGVNQNQPIADTEADTEADTPTEKKEAASLSLFEDSPRKRPKGKGKASPRLTLDELKAIPLPAGLNSVDMRSAVNEFIDYRAQIKAPFKTRLGVEGMLRLLEPLGQALAIEAMRITREKEWQGVEHGISEMERRQSGGLRPGVKGGSPLKMIFPVKPNRTPEEEARMSEGAEIAED